jgi:AraC-like DNA-binding protein
VSSIGRRRADTLERRGAVLREARSFMARELSRALSLEEVATQVATSPRHLQRVFSEQGTTFRSLLRDLRMQRAVEMLRSGRTVSEVATAVGYASTRTFRRAFTSVVGGEPGKDLAEEHPSLVSWHRTTLVHRGRASS